MPPEDLIGKVVGDCEIAAEIGEGGMGVIYRAKQISLDRPVAVKVLSDRFAGDPVFVERFQREAKAIAKLSHPNILAVYFVGIEESIPGTGGGVHYMMMELVDGRNLSEVLEERGLLPVHEAFDIVQQAARGLQCAHDAGVIHRDVKPDNLMVSKNGIVKVSDFGLAKELEQSLTATDAVMGTPAYMSPEQCDGKRLDVRSDVYSLGGTFYRLVTGRLPFEAETAMSMMYRHKHEPLAPPIDIVPTISSGVSDVIVKMMAKRPEDRFQTMDEVIIVLEDAKRSARGPSTGTETIVESPSAIVPPWKRGAAASAVAKAVEEAERHRDVGERMLADGKYPEAARAFRNAIELNPSDAHVQASLREAEGKLVEKRGLSAQVRQHLNKKEYDLALQAWELIPNDLKDPAVEEEIQRIRDSHLPAFKLAEEADKLNADGDIDRAMELYEEAIELDASCGPAEKGKRDIERKRAMIERKLREGYDYSERREYEAAISAWQSIFHLCPGHERAKKLVVDAITHLAHHSRSEEGGSWRAISHLKRILEIDPGNGQAEKLIEEENRRAEEIRTLSERASRFFSRRKYAAAIETWQRLKKVEPANKRASDSMERAQKLQRRRRIARLAMLLALLAAVLLGRVLYQEWMLKDRVKRLVAESKEGLPAAERIGKLEEAVAAHDSYRALGYLRMLFFFRGVRGLAKEARYEAALAHAVTARTDKDYVRAEKYYDAAARLTDDPEKAAKVRLDLLETQHERFFSAAESLEEKKDWRNASKTFIRAAEKADEAGTAERAEWARTRAKFAEVMAEALRFASKGLKEEARRLYLQLPPLVPDHPALKDVPVLAEYDEAGAKGLLKEAKALVSSGRLGEAAGRLAEALKKNPGLAPVKSLLRYCRDMLWCEEKGMLLVNRGPKPDTEAASRDWLTVRKTAFCIDRFEYPNHEGQAPVSESSWIEAEAACRRGGKRLCYSKLEWMAACSGPDKLPYPYGLVFKRGVCNVGAGVVAGAGEFGKCRSYWGVLDMTGNVSEWTAESAADRRFYYGGYWGSDERGSRCDSRVEALATTPVVGVGFRCCADLPKEEKQ